MQSLKIDKDKYRYDVMIGVGGIGAGSFFALNGNHTLGREESRGGRFLDRNDYCKLHIISHYVQTLLGREFKAIPVGKVGDDDLGKRLYAEMEEAGLDMRYVETSSGDRTMYAFCFIYPDGSGGNLTPDDSACSRVDAVYVNEADSEFARFAGRGIALAVPEVPLEAREAILKLGTKHHFLRVASFSSEEIPGAIESGILGEVDLLAVNLDEAAAVAGIQAEPEEIVKTAISILSKINPGMLVSITAGSRGSWTWDGFSVSHVPVFKANVSCTAGAGDAHLSGIIAGLAVGLPLAEAQQLGTLVAGLSVTSPHTINKDINRESLRQFAETSKVNIPNNILALLNDK